MNYEPVWYYGNGCFSKYFLLENVLKYYFENLFLILVYYNNNLKHIKNLIFKILQKYFPNRKKKGGAGV